MHYDILIRQNGNPGNLIATKNGNLIERQNDNLIERQNDNLIERQNDNLMIFCRLNKKIAYMEGGFRILIPCFCLLWIWIRFSNISGSGSVS